MQKSAQIILVTGATGYIGGRLVPKLLVEGYRVRLLVRDANRIKRQSWQNEVEVYEGDVLKIETIEKVMQGVTTAFYLIHSMMTSSEFHERDIRAAENFGGAAKKYGIGRIIYLGGLGDPDTQLSRHLSSRQQTGETLRQSGIQVLEFRAAVVVGSGSVSFEMIRYLSERLPVMICPRWVYTRTQPISIRDILDYLVAGISLDIKGNVIVELGGADVITYAEMMLKYAEVRRLRRLLIRVPVLTPRLSSHWVHWMTPIPTEIARPLIDGLKNEVVVRESKAITLFPQIEPMSYKEAVIEALDHLEASEIEPTWSDSVSSSVQNRQSVNIINQEGMILERRQNLVNAPPARVFEEITSLGGQNGQLFMNFAWQVRGSIDRIFGGDGLRRGRRDAKMVRVGDAIDFWRVEEISKNDLLRLKAEIKLPGKAWLQYEVSPLDEVKCYLTQTVFFAPKGLPGFIYWYSLYPIHGLKFSGLIGRIKKRSEEDFR